MSPLIISPWIYINSQINNYHFDKFYKIDSDFLIFENEINTYLKSSYISEYLLVQNNVNLKQISNFKNFKLLSINNLNTEKKTYVILNFDKEIWDTDKICIDKLYCINKYQKFLNQNQFKEIYSYGGYRLYYNG